MGTIDLAKERKVDWKDLNINDVKRYVEAFDICYEKSENEIIEAFRDDSHRADVVKKQIHLLNGFYHTRVPVVPMQEVLIGLQNSEQWDDWIKNGAEDAVRIIAECNGKNYFSFATKYCCFLNSDKFPIYDSMSIKALKMLDNQKSFLDDKIDFEKIRIGKEYGKYRCIVNSFMKKFKLNDKKINYKDIDKFLWLVGKNL